MKVHHPVCALEEINTSGVVQADYIYLDGRPVAVLNGSTLYYLHDDMLGTPQLATDSSQNIQWQASYDPFGQASVSGTITQNLRLPGQYFDVESGWNHNGFRDYAPTLGRYIEPDPLGIQGSNTSNNYQAGRFSSEDQAEFEDVNLDLYVYASDDPINYTDPTGCSFKNCAAALTELTAALARLAEREAEHAAHGGKDCTGMDHEKAIEQAKNRVRNAVKRARGCLPDEELDAILKDLNKMIQGIDPRVGVGIGGRNRNRGWDSHMPRVHRARARTLLLDSHCASR